MDLMEAAEQFGMRKYLACCENCIATDLSGRFEHALTRMPPGGSVRTAKCIDRVCRLKNYPPRNWPVETFLHTNINGYA